MFTVKKCLSSFKKRRKNMKEFFGAFTGVVFAMFLLVLTINLGWYLKWDTLAQLKTCPVTLNRSVCHFLAIKAHNKNNPDYKVIVLDEHDNDSCDKKCCINIDK